MTADGFALVRKVGSGDCPAGCINNEYFYYVTDENCQSQQVGHYLPASSVSSEGCLVDVGEPLWGIPPARDPLLLCGTSSAAEDISGTYRLHATGSWWPCAEPGATVEAVWFDAVVTLSIEQDAALSSGTVTFEGTGEPLIDGHQLPAQFQRRRFVATYLSGSDPAACGNSITLSVAFDFEGYGRREITLDQKFLGSGTDCTCEGARQLGLRLCPTLPN